MPPAVKENEILTSIPDNATARPATGSNTDSTARPQPVALQVPVTVNGARTVSGSPKREPFSETTTTVLIFGHGAVVRLTSPVAPGQLLFLTNEKTKKEVVCQVVNSKNYSGVSGYVELEFTEPVAGFWGMRFPAATQSHAQESASASSSTTRNSAGTPASKSEAPVTAAPIQPETKPAIPASPRLAEPVLSGSRNSSSQTPAPRPGATNSAPASLSATPSSASSVPSSETFEHAKPTQAAPVAPAPPLAPKSFVLPSSSLLDSDEIKIPSWLEPLARNAAAASAALPEIGAKESVEEFGDLPLVNDLSVTEITDTPESANANLPSSPFGTHFLADEQDPLSEQTATAGKSNKKFLIAAIAAAGLLLVGAGGWYVRQSSDNTAANNSATTAAAVSAPSNTATSRGSNTSRTPSQPVRSAAPEKPSAKFTDVSTPANVEPNVSTAAKTAKFVDASKPNSTSNKSIGAVDSPEEVADTPDVAPRPKKQNLGSVKLSAPIRNATVGPTPAEEALNLEPTQPVTGLAPSLMGSSSSQPVAPNSAADVKTATLISSVSPVYPAMAKTQRITGAVTIDALIDATGRVASMAVVSGPALLQEAAKEALSHWKYQPALLHGKPVPMHMKVTIQFKLQ